ncbi:DUF4142 domain-containing protein [Acetobacteraceae bacterium KSS8]|uniref:DUF4142 domain-containing protein n=1 Tax=Endosaccharibacter trunci TaxID=2812733 RepID=A0ABT1W6E3_9PROT|nr:DUF4142 domain-containing protein [Acetobacteraceae bacterium KSS8]
MIRRKHALLLLPLLTVAACAGPAGTESGPTATGDAGFVQTAFQGGMAEELAAGYATSKAMAPATKSFATRMLSDFDNMNAGLRAAATKAGITVPSSASPDQLAAINTLSQQSGAAFDKGYIAAEITRQKALLQAYQTEAASGANPALKTYAAQGVPVLESNLTAAESLSGS